MPLRRESTRPYPTAYGVLQCRRHPGRKLLTPRQGKQLLSVFKEAKGAYQEKKGQIKSERARLNRAQTFDQYPPRSTPRTRGLHNYQDYWEEEDGDDDGYSKYYDGPSRRRSFYDAPSEAYSRRTHRRSRSTHSKRHRDHDVDHRSNIKSRPPLTERNLKTHSEVSSTAPSRAPPGHYRSPYVETLGRDPAASKMDMTYADVRSFAVTERTRPQSTTMSRRRSLTEMRGRPESIYGPRIREPHHGGGPVKEIDMNLAYGDIPPDLADRVDLDPAYQEKHAKSLVRKVEALLDEAHCLQHSAKSTIAHLQKNPDTAAAVALSLAELSSVIGKMSPAFIGLLKGGSPAVFALLSSPQFLIGSAAVVGVTVVMFGGWKIVKKVRDAQNAREAMAYEGVPLGRPAPLRTQSEFSAGMDEALVLDEELSTIESWRRGILPEFGENESADMELITPEAERARNARKGKGDEFDIKSRKSAKTSKTAKSSKTKRDMAREVPERKSSRKPTAESVAGSERSGRSSRDKGKRPLRTLEDGRSRRGDEGIDLVFRPKAQRQDNMLKALFKTKKDKERELVRV